MNLLSCFVSNIKLCNLKYHFKLRKTNLIVKMSTRSPKIRNVQKKTTENNSETITSPVLVENVDLSDQDVAIAGPLSA